MQGGSWRATWGKLALSRLRRLDDATRDRVRAEIGDERLARFREASILEWLPAAEYAAFATAISAVLGPRGARALWRDTLEAGLDRPLLKPLVLGTRALHGGQPGPLYRRAKEAWVLVTRDAGAIDVTVDEPARHAHLVFTDLDPALRVEPIIAVFHGNCEAVLRFLGATGRVDEQLEHLQRGFAVLDVTWAPAPER